MLDGDGPLDRSVTTMHSVEVTNTGNVTGDCVVMAFITANKGSPPHTPLKKLFGFQRLVALKPG